MLREFYISTILLIFLNPHSVKTAGNFRGKCYKYINGTKSTTVNCCDRYRLDNPCDDVRCQAGHICELVPMSIHEGDICDEDVIPLKPRCKTPCKPPKFCKKGCFLVKDLHGYNFCFCNRNFKDPCSKRPCKESEDCTLQQIQCFSPPCHPIANCIPRKRCPRVKKCPANCLKYKGHDGCSRCFCCNKCVNKRCPGRSKCVLKKVRCVRCPCHPRAVCE